jgi:hypothetical protein
MDQIEKDVLKWYNHNRYRRLGSDVSVTELLKPPRIVHLINRHRHTIARPSLDVVLPSLQGNGIHDQLQRYLKQDDLLTGKWQIERHLLSVVQGYRLSGRFDALYDNKDLYDIKVTRAWKFEKGDYKEWEQQLNIYDWMLWKDGINLRSLKILGVVLDWQATKQYVTGYPSGRTQVITIPRWSRQKQETFIDTRITSWSSSRPLSDNKLPLCTTSDRWAGSPVFKLYRTPTMKRSYKNFSTLPRARKYLAVCKAGDADKWKDAKIITDWPNKWNRCDTWCEVSHVCNQYQNKIEV